MLSPSSRSLLESMETSCACLRTAPSTPLYIPFTAKHHPFLVPILTVRRNPRSRLSLFPPSALQSPRGFGPSPKKKNRKQKKRPTEIEDEDDEDDDRMEGSDDGTIPEIVTNRMISRMGFTVGIPLAIGLLFFPFFYYLKVVVKIDVPTWVPFIVSFFFFGSALLGVSYGIVSSSWDPLREGSLLGWNETQKNWPVFWQSLWGRSGKK